MVLHLQTEQTHTRCNAKQGLENKFKKKKNTSRHGHTQTHNSVKWTHIKTFVVLTNLGFYPATFQ
jgi:hypothetical protein